MVRTTKEFIVATKIVSSTIIASIIGPSIETFQFIADDLCFGDYAH